MQGVFSIPFSALQITFSGPFFRKMKRFFVFSIYVILYFFGFLGIAGGGPTRISRVTRKT
ncbi:hypothetical protein LEP1GSC124_4735 [Leptospira interrogans serovar Pyrogenes str. 200701872]|uniref:Uncharacterized protein n=1 Tax=Leptospira interrogans serovar Pyrogenes str. 200701872 TaxID=1193029 RepID=M6ZE94_LEPIR|nr:hypothetical protein LEP1GSC124_4735 [Leptospira interrogans serovar Pyrogenes str. 200701872]